MKAKVPEAGFIEETMTITVSGIPVSLVQRMDELAQRPPKTNRSELTKLFITQGVLEQEQMARHPALNRKKGR